MKHRIEERPSLQVVGYTLRTTTVGGESQRVIPGFWDEHLSSGKVQSLERVGSAWGTLGLCTDFDERMEGFTYVIGVEAQPGTAAPPGTEVVTIPAARYAVFGCEGTLPDAIQKGWATIMEGWFPQAKVTRASPVNFELYPRFPEGDERGDPSSPRCYSEIWIPIQEK